MSNATQIPHLSAHIDAASVPPGGGTAPAGQIAPAVEQPVATADQTAPPQPAHTPAPAPGMSKAPGMDGATPQSNAAVSTPQAAPQRSSVREQLESRQFEVPQHLTTDAQVMDFLAQQIDDSNAAQEQPSAAPPQQGAGVASAPLTPASPSEPLNPLKYKVSNEARQLVDAGILAKTEDGWAANVAGIDPRYAAELNTQEAVRIQNARRITEQPLDFFKDAANELGFVRSDDVKALQEELNVLRDERLQERQLTENAKIDSWIDSHADSVWINGDPQQGMAPYGAKFQEMEHKIREWANGEPLSRAELHGRTLKLMNDIGFTPESFAMQGADQPAAQESQPASTFMSTVPASQQGAQNRLHDHAAMQPPATPQVTLGKGGWPSLMNHIQTNPAQLQ